MQRFGSVNGPRASNYAAAGKNAADAMVSAFATQRRYGPNYTDVIKTAQAAETAKTVAAVKAQEVFTKAAIGALGDAKAGEARGRALEARLGQQTQQRMAGILPAVGEVVGSVFKKDPKRPPPRLQVAPVAPAAVPYPTGVGERTAPPGVPTLEPIPSLEGADTPTAGAAKLVPTDGIRTEAYNYLISKHGLSRNKALGIIANIDRESSFRPSIASGDDGGAGGLFQWFGSRQTPRVQELVRTGNWKGQIDYALSEPGEPYSRTYQETTFDSPQSAADGWMINFERPAHPDKDSRRHTELLSGYSF